MQGNVTLVEHQYGGRGHLSVSNCNQLIIKRAAFSGTRVQSLLVVNVTHVILTQRALQFKAEQRRRFAFIVHNATITELPTELFYAQYEQTVPPSNIESAPKVQLIVNNSRIGVIGSAMFGNTRLHDLTITNNTIGTIQTHFLNTTVEGNVNITRNHINTVHRDAILITKSRRFPDNFVLTFNTFEGE